ncbi:MAG: PTS transporter subunit EIIC [Betaproteobacteria bacterium]|nr:PTS transporter subunit EIIC [Betaproteobacteria bacterium]
MKRLIESTQQLGRALMLPIAVLPVAGLLLRLGQPDLMNLAPVAAAGDAIFSNLGILFAIGVAVGLARENNGAAGLAAVVGFLVATKGAEVLIQVPPDLLAKGDLVVAAHKAKQLAKLSVPIGIISGLISGWLYNRYSEIRLPSYLAFFGGRRFVPIAAGCAGLVVAAVFGMGWGTLESAMDAASRAVLGAGEFGLFVYGVLNRLLIVTGLHHILNNLAWFLVGDFNGVTGDLKRFFAGDPTAGMFMSGFFPVMMFGLPAACLAMYRTALPERRRATGGLLLSMALTSFLTGVTEPIEFTFMFLAPILYVLHAVLTGLSMVTMDVLNSKLGFGFSAGLFDYVLNFNKATHPLYLIPVGAIYFALYYGLFHWFIVRFDLKTPGRDKEEQMSVAVAGAGDAATSDAFIEALGGAANLRNVDACTTRLRLVLANRDLVREDALKRLGSRGMVKLGTDGLQVVLGPIADQVAGDIRKRLGEVPRASVAAPANVNEPVKVISGSVESTVATALLAAVGGSANVKRIELAAGRVLITVSNPNAVDEKALRSIETRGIARPQPASVHVLHADAAALEQQMVMMLAT